MKKEKSIHIILIVLLACVVMGLVDAVWQPGYIIKSVVKIFLFLLLPILYTRFDRKCSLKKLLIPEKKGFLLALVLGIGIYFVIVGAYFVFRNVFDFSGLTSSLTQTTGVSKENFLWVALYISFINSLLEEFFFRGFAFLTLKRVSGKEFAYLFSSLAFAAYHTAMMIGWFELSVIVLALLGLFVGGLIFDRFDEKNENIYLSWLVHMFANFATNTVGFILFLA